VHLNISGGTHVNIKFTDDFGTVCVNHGASTNFFRSNITGTVSGNVLQGQFQSAHCGTLPLKFLQGAPVEYELDDQDNNDPADDTLSDGLVTWHRV
jgi:hypothetical protein